MKPNEKIKLQSEAVTLLGKFTGLTSIKKIPLITRLTDIVALLIAVVITYVAPVFKRARSLKDFFVNAKSFCANSDVSKGVPLNVLNDCGEALLEATERFSMPKMKFFGSGARAPYKHRIGRAYACYLAYTDPNAWGLVDQININTKLKDETHESKIEIEKIMESRYPLILHKDGSERVGDGRARKIIDELTEWPWSVSTTTAANIMFHEMGHRWHAYMRTKGDELDVMVNKQYKAGWARVISQYGMTNANEYIAEAFSCYMQDKHNLICPELLTMMKENDKAAI
jgi:hypothetical protein